MITLLIIAIILLVLIIPTLYMLWWKCHIHILNPKKPFGTDKTMTSWPVAIPIINGFQFKNDNHWPQFYHQFKENVTQLLSQPNSPFKIYFDRKRQVFKFHDTLNMENIFHEYDNDELCNKPYLPHQISVIINACPQNAWISIVWDHVSFDGTRLYNEVLAPLFGLKIYQPDMYFSKYMPFYTEWRMALLMWHYRHIIKNKPLTTFSNYQDQYVCFFRFESKFLKQMKNKYNCTLSEIILAQYCYQLFALTEKKSLVIGLLVACHHERFRNNYSIMCISITKACLKNIIQQIITQRHQKSTIQAMYQMLTFSSTQTYLKENILDCLISPFFFQAKRSFSSQINNFEFMNIPSSLPLYSLYISYKNNIHISITINTPSINLNKAKYKPIKIIPYKDLYPAT